MICLFFSFPRDSRAAQYLPNIISGESAGNTTSDDSGQRDVSAEWGGHFKVRGYASWPDDRSVFHPLNPGTLYDGSAEARIKNTVYFGGWGYFETHYEAIFSTGDTRDKSAALEKAFPGLFEEGLLTARPVDDDRRFLDLTGTVTEDDRDILYHRLDRLSLTLLPGQATVRVGRQAVTWGNGLLFNPMDLFNPFSPTDIERDYKIGDDMVFTQFSVGGLGEFQFLFVPRRNPANGKIEGDESSLAGKLHFARGTTEFDLMASKHFKDAVFGVGSRGYIGDAAWRLDATWTVLDQEADEEDFLSLVANVDYSWIWWDKNVYGFIEFYYNGLGRDNYTEAFADPEVAERLDRGELFTLGRALLGGHIRIELHPLVNVFFTVINNLHDPSGILQPRATWDMTEDLQMTLGANVLYGGKDTEFGGFQVPGTTLYTKSPDSVFLWFSYYF